MLLFCSTNSVTFKLKCALYEFGFCFKHCCQVCRNIWTESYKWNFFQRQWYTRQILSEGAVMVLPSTCSLAKKIKSCTSLPLLSIHKGFEVKINKLVTANTLDCNFNWQVLSIISWQLVRNVCNFVRQLVYFFCEETIFFDQSFTF